MRAEHQYLSEIKKNIKNLGNSIEAINNKVNKLDRESFEEAEEIWSDNQYDACSDKEIKAIKAQAKTLKDTIQTAVNSLEKEVNGEIPASKNLVQKLEDLEAISKTANRMINCPLKETFKANRNVATSWGHTIAEKVQTCFEKIKAVFHLGNKNDIHQVKDSSNALRRALVITDPNKKHNDKNSKLLAEMIKKEEESENKANITKTSDEESLAETDRLSIDSDDRSSTLSM